MPLRLGIDIACRAAHQVSLADEQGRFIWTGRRFRTTADDLARLWAMLPEGTDPAEVLVVMEPTRNAWVPLAAWFRRRGAEVILVPAERSADLRRYYAKHTSPTGWTPSCWPGCRCCTPTACMSSRVLGLVMR
jgi:transposase